MNRRTFLASLGAAGLGHALLAQGGGTSAAPGETAEPLGAFAPYLQFTGAERCDVRWRTTRPATGTVRWRQGDGPWQTAMAERDGLIQANRCEHCVPIEGIDPTRPLSIEVASAPCLTFEPYKIRLGAEEIQGRAELKPRLAGDRLSLVIFNDLHGQTHLIPKLLDQPDVAALAPTIALFNGDCADDCQDVRGLDRRFLSALPPLCARGLTPLVLRGNHEYRGVMARRLRKHLSPLASGRYYGAFTLGPVRFLCLDTGEDKPDSHPVYGGLLATDAYLAAEAAWLKRELASEAWRAARWRVAIGHIPPFSHNPKDDAWYGPTRLRREIAPLLANAGLTAMICGHNHAYAFHGACDEHPYPILVGGGPSEGSATATVLTASPNALDLRAYTLHGPCPETIYGRFTS